MAPAQTAELHQSLHGGFVTAGLEPAWWCCSGFVQVCNTMNAGAAVGYSSHTSGEQPMRCCRFGWAGQFRRIRSRRTCQGTTAFLLVTSATTSTTVRCLRPSSHVRAALMRGSCGTMPPTGNPLHPFLTSGLRPMHPFPTCSFPTFDFPADTL